MSDDGNARPPSLYDSAGTSAHVKAPAHIKHENFVSKKCFEKNALKKCFGRKVSKLKSARSVSNHRL